ncbi:MAG TPA: iron-containing alcohol dehydrogenase [Chloroflexota bacterium]|nr:iron-containing alcohol dehydrogenase [Chloroflexota bacterium]
MAGNVATFRMPNQVSLGIGASETVGVEAKRLGATHAFLVCDGVLKQFGIIDQVVSSLSAQGISSTLYTNVEYEPSIQSVDPCQKAAVESSCDVVVAVGGGTTLDTAKTVAMLLGNGGKAMDYLGTGLVKKRGVPSILMPTTSGTGSEITPNALFYVPELKDKRAVVSPFIVPDVAIVDPLLTMSVPPSVTAATGVDALSHAVESYTSTKASPMTDVFALEAIRLIGMHLRTAVANGQDLAAREGMAKASLFAGITIANAGTNLVHALAYPLQGLFRITHGVANSLMLPWCMDFNALSNLPKFTQIAVAMGEPIANLSMRDAASRSAVACRLLSEDVGIPKRLSDIGVKAETIDVLVEGAMKQTRLLDNNPRRVRPEDVRAIYERAL